MGFLNLHFGWLFPIDTAIMKCTRKKYSLPMQGETISVRAMMKIGHAAVHHESAIVRHVCCACYAMGLGAIRLDQLNRTCILGEYSPSGCLQCYTYLDKDGACGPSYIPVVGFHDRSWVDSLLSSTADVVIAGFLLKEDGSTNGDPFLASKFKRRPTRGCCVTKCVREILVMGYDVPHPQFKKLGTSSFRKFMPTIAKLFKLEGNRRADVGWWSGSLAKEDGLVPKDRVACVFAARQVVRKTREAVLAHGGISHLPIIGGWDTLFPNTTVSSLSSDGIDSDNSSSNSYTE